MLQDVNESRIIHRRSSQIRRLPKTWPCEKRIHWCLTTPLVKMVDSAFRWICGAKVVAAAFDYLTLRWCLFQTRNSSLSWKLHQLRVTLVPTEEMLLRSTWAFAFSWRWQGWLVATSSWTSLRSLVLVVLAPNKLLLGKRALCFQWEKLFVYSVFSYW